MQMRALIGGGFLALLAGAGGIIWWEQRSPPQPAQAQASEAETLPVPPLPPRIAQGGQYERCLALLPQDPEGAASFAEAWQTEGGGVGAAHCLALARIALGEPQEGAVLLERLAGTSAAPDSARAVAYDQAAQARLMAGEAGRAFDDSSRAVALSPDTPDLLIDRALAAEALERWQDAVDDLNEALDADPRRPDALVLRGSALRHLGRLASAREDVDRALALDPENAEALLERGILRQRRDDRPGARADWERTIALAPDSQAAELARQNLALLEVGPERH
jgi:tetratricopeptide (TPR) repeat protein